MLTITQSLDLLRKKLNVLQEIVATKLNNTSREIFSPQVEDLKKALNKITADAKHIDKLALEPLKEKTNELVKFIARLIYRADKITADLQIINFNRLFDLEKYNEENLSALEEQTNAFLQKLPQQALEQHKNIKTDEPHTDSSEESDFSASENDAEELFDVSLNSDEEKDTKTKPPTRTASATAFHTTKGILRTNSLPSQSTTSTQEPTNAPTEPRLGK